MTNADRIRAMTDEELMEWMADHVDCGEACPAFHICRRTPMEDMDCKDWLLKWLKMEGEE